MMFEGTLHNLDRLWRLASPFLLTLILVLLALIPTRIPELATIQPLLPLIAIYHWTVFRPDLMPMVLVFLAGMLEDLLSGGPMGIHTLMMLIVYGLVQSQRKFLFRKPFLVNWIGFAIFSAAAEIAAWTLGSLSLFAALPIRPFFFQFLITLALFPLLALALALWERHIIREY